MEDSEHITNLSCLYWSDEGTHFRASSMAMASAVKWEHVGGGRIESTCCPRMDVTISSPREQSKF